MLSCANTRSENPQARSRVLAYQICRAKTLLMKVTHFILLFSFLHCGVVRSSSCKLQATEKVEGVSNRLREGMDSVPVQFSDPFTELATSPAVKQRSCFYLGRLFLTAGRLVTTAIYEVMQSTQLYFTLFGPTSQTNPQTYC